MSWFDRWRGLSLDPPGSLGFLYALLAAALIAYAVVVYRKSDAPLPGRARALLAALRSTTLLLLLLLLCRPVLSLALPGGAARGVLLLLDRSASMTLPGRSAGESREDELQRAARAARAELEGDYPLSVRGFDAVLHAPAPDGPLAPPAGDATDLARALEQGLAEGGPEGRPGAVVLVTDGTQTAGTDPVPLARRAGVPIEAVALGAPTPVPDFAVARVRVNREAFAGERTPLEAVLRLQGLPVGSVQVRLLDVTDGEVELAAIPIHPENEGAETRVRLSFTPTATGLRFLEVRVPALPGEATVANNRRLVAVEVQKGKTGVLLLTGNLTWDHTFVKRALGEDSTLALTAGVWKGNAFSPLVSGGTLPALRAGALREYRVVVLDHVSPGQIEESAIATLAGFVREGGGLLLLTGSEPGIVTSWKATPLGGLLPVQVGGMVEVPEVQVRLTAAARRHEVFEEAVPGALPLADWDDLPPVALAPDLGPARAGAEALLVPSAGNPDRALMAWVRDGSGRVVVLGGGGFWRWGFRGTSAAPTLDGWWRRLAHWLARSEVESRLEIHPEEFVTARGKPVTFVGRVSDESYQPVPDVEVEVLVSTAGEEPRRLALSGTEGVLRGVLDGLPPGRYRYAGTARVDGRVLGTVDGSFAVDSLGTEMERLEADPEALLRLAKASGGRVWHPDSLDALGETLRSASRAGEERVQLALWDHPALFALIVALASLEWYLRRRRGLV